MKNYKAYTLNNEFIKNCLFVGENFTGILKHNGGCEWWYLNGLLHRLGGPAMIFGDGTKEYYIQDTRYTKEEHDILYSIMKLKQIIEI